MRNAPSDVLEPGRLNSIERSLPGKLRVWERHASDLKLGLRARLRSDDTRRSQCGRRSHKLSPAENH